MVSTTGTAVNDFTSKKSSPETFDSPLEINNLTLSESVYNVYNTLYSHFSVVFATSKLIKEKGEISK